MAISFYLNTTKNENRPALIMMKVYHHQFLNRVCVCSTKERIERKYWKQEAGWPKKGQDSLERRLMEIKIMVTDFIRNNSKSLTREALRKHLSDSAPREVMVERPKSLLQEWDGYLHCVKSGLASRTYRSYRNSYQTMEEFLSGLKKPDIAPSDFDTALYQEYRNFLNGKYSSGNSVAKRIRHLKMLTTQIVRLAVDHKEIKYKETAGLKIRLTEEDQTLAVRFLSPDILFEQNSSKIRPRFQEILEDFFPKYIQILSSEKYKNDIEEIRIEGHTSSEASGLSIEQAYFYNMRLSQDRTRSVLSFVLELNGLKDQNWVRKNLTANGLSSSKLVMNNGLEDKVKSRRVEFRVRTNAEQRIVKIITE